MIDIKEFRKYLEIDKNALDEEIVRQPSLLYKVSEAFAEAAAERDKFKEVVALTDAEQDGIARFENEKATEGAIKAIVAKSEPHLDAFEEWAEAKKKADILLALKDAFQQRSYMLRDLVTLYTANYFETESVKPTSSQDKLVYRRAREKMAITRANRD